MLCIFFLFLFSVSIMDPSGSGAEGMGRWAACLLSVEQGVPRFCPVHAVPLGRSLPWSQPPTFTPLLPASSHGASSLAPRPGGGVSCLQLLHRCHVDQASVPPRRQYLGHPRIFPPAASGHKARNPWLSPLPLKCLYHYCNYFTMCGNSLRI